VKVSPTSLAERYESAESKSVAKVTGGRAHLYSAILV